MRPLIPIAKWLAAAIAAGVLFLIIVANFGTVESRLECPGEIRQTGNGGAGATPATLYAKTETYRWFVFWADDDATIFWEIPRGQRPTETGFGYYSHSDFGMPIHEFRGPKQYGSLSPLSNRIYIATSPDGSEVFEGLCR